MNIWGQKQKLYPIMRGVPLPLEGRRVLVLVSDVNKSYKSVEVVIFPYGIDILSFLPLLVLVGFSESPFVVEAKGWLYFLERGPR